MLTYRELVVAKVTTRTAASLTTPESLESILVSATIDPHVLLTDVRAVIVDEVHAFAGDDRGWHLLAVLERLTHLTGRPLQRIGLSATIGNPNDLLGWLQGSSAGRRPGVVVAPDAVAAAPAEVGLDCVGSVANAARVIAALHRGEKRLVFADSRRPVEQLAVQLGEHEVETFVSHSSLSASDPVPRVAGLRVLSRVGWRGCRESGVPGVREGRLSRGVGRRFRPRRVFRVRGRSVTRRSVVGAG